jgi:hypothetical protein
MAKQNRIFAVFCPTWLQDALLTDHPSRLTPSRLSRFTLRPVQDQPLAFGERAPPSHFRRITLPHFLYLPLLIVTLTRSSALSLTLSQGEL